MKAFGMCLNWRVVAGLAVVAIGVWVFAPHLIGAALPLLIVAACPLSMLVMMRGMGNMGGARRPESTAQPRWADPRAAGEYNHEQRLADLHTRVASIQAEQDAIAREIAALGGQRNPVVRQAEDVARAEAERISGAQASAE